MITSISQPTFVSSTSVQRPTSNPSNPVGGIEALNSQASKSVVDTTKFQPAQTDSSKPVESSQPSSELSAEAKQVIDQLKARDAEVRAHEQSHLSAAGGYATGRASYSYQLGPDGRRYAIGGEVGIDVSPVAGDPEATLLKANMVQRAALAPAEPSAQDMRVASAAIQMASQARMEIASQAFDESRSLNADENSDKGERDVVAEGEKTKTIESNSSLQDSPLLLDRNGFALRMQLQPVT